MGNKHIKTREGFIERARIANDNKYTYDKVEFTPRENVLNWKGEKKRKPSEYNRNQKIIVTCPKHGDFEVTARKHLQGIGCKYCSREKRSKVQYNKQKEADFTDCNSHIVEKDEVKIFSTPSDGIEREILISLEDVDILQYTNWYVTGHQPSRNSRTCYCTAEQNVRIKSENLQWLGKKPLMHRLVMSRILGRELERNEIIDHVNGNGLDNRRENLRISTNSQNLANRRKNCNNTSGFKGVQPKRKKYSACVGFQGKKIRLGVYDTPEEAARAYDEKAKELFGEYANLNFPDDE